jgi:plastocyanin domain-containing protein
MCGREARLPDTSEVIMIRPLLLIGSLSFALMLGSSVAPSAAAARQQDESNRQEFTITASEKGFDPATVTLKKGVPARLTFIRTSDKTCATEVAIPAYKVKKELPLNAKVSIQFTPEEAGDVSFACGHNMFKGTLVVQ